MLVYHTSSWIGYYRRQRRQCREESYFDSWPLPLILAQPPVTALLCPHTTVHGWLATDGKMVHKNSATCKNNKNTDLLTIQLGLLTLSPRSVLCWVKSTEQHPEGRGEIRNATLPWLQNALSALCQMCFFQPICYRCLKYSCIPSNNPSFFYPSVPVY